MSPAEAVEAPEPAFEPETPQNANAGPLRADQGLSPSRRRNLMRLYGLTTEDFVLLCAGCGDRCPMCLKPFRPGGPVSRQPCIEHDHRTGECYGVCDGHCNDLLGYYGRDPAFYERVAAFLRDPPARQALGRRHYVPGAPPRPEE